MNIRVDAEEAAKELRVKHIALGVRFPDSPQEHMEAFKEYQTRIMLDITRERIRQNEKWTPGPLGIQRKTLDRWMLVLGEEIGESAEAALDVIYGGTTEDWAHLREELIQSAAVIVAIIERVDAHDPALVTNG